jgi:hypothetical protein
MGSGLLRLAARPIAVIMIFGSFGGIFTNLKHLQRFGFERTSSWYALAGIVFALGVLTVCVCFLRSSFSKRRDSL